MLTSTQLVVGASAAAVASASLTLLIAIPDHDLARSLSLIGMFFAGLATHHVLCELRADSVNQRLARVEGVTATMARTEKAVLSVLSDDRTRHLN